MKRLILGILFIMAFSASAFAADGLQPVNLQGDTVYLVSTGKVAICAGTTLASFAQNLIEVRGEACPPMDDRNALYGGAVSLSINEAVTRLGGTWPIPFKSSIGVGGMADIANHKVEPAIILTVLKITF